LIAALPASANFTPDALFVPSTVGFSGTYNDSNSPGNPVADSGSFSINSASTFTAPQTTGTYSYTKTGESTATLTYTSNYSLSGDTETETSTVQLTFTTANGGTFTSSGSYSGVEDGFSYNGSFTGTGTFTYTYANTAPTISAVADVAYDIGSVPAMLSIQATVGDIQSGAGWVCVTAESSDMDLVPDENIAVSGTGTERTVEITPVGKKSGQTTITLTASDGNLTATETFDVTISVGVVTQIMGTGHTVSRNESPLPLSNGDPVFEKDVFRTGASGFIKITLGDHSVITVGSNSEAEIVEAAPANTSLVGYLFGLVRGYLKTEASQNARENFRIKTRQIALGVRGTVFEVTAETGQTTVDVTEGTVEVIETSTGRTSILNAGDSQQIISDGSFGATLVSTGNKQGSFDFYAERGFAYRLLRSTDLDFSNSATLGSIAGDDSPASLPFDDSSSSDPAAFFRIERVAIDAG
jgi:hypothetical protein